MRNVLIDCAECIPCNPCASFCPAGAISIGDGLTGLPAVDLGKCTGCALCVAACPGQACFVVDEDYAPGLAAVDFPYEYFPVPQAGDAVQARNNEGRVVCEGTVMRVSDQPAYRQTKVICISVPREHAREVRGIGIFQKEGPGDAKD
jgi:Fe-S-cluster-containing hydrogenase component 2